MSIDAATTSGPNREARPPGNRTRRFFHRITNAGAARPNLVLVTWSVVLAFLVASAGALWWQTYRANSVTSAGVAALDAANKEIVKVLSYQPATVDTDLAAAGQGLTGRFKDDFATLAGNLIAPAAKKDNITTRAAVVSSSIVSADSDRVVTLLFVNQTTQSNVQRDPRVDGSRLRVTLQKVADRWLISDLIPV